MVAVYCFANSPLNRGANGIDTQVSRREYDSTCLGFALAGERNRDDELGAFAGAAVNFDPPAMHFGGAFDDR